MSEGSTAERPPFRHLLRVRYAECDGQKVVFNAVYGLYVSVACNEFMRAIGYGDERAGGGMEIQLVKQTTEWRASARFDEVIEIAVQCVQLGNTSFTLGYEFRRHGEAEWFARSETVYVNVDPVTMRKRPLDEAFRAAATAGARGLCSDHAGALRAFVEVHA